MPSNVPDFGHVAKDTGWIHSKVHSLLSGLAPIATEILFIPQGKKIAV